MIIIFRWLKDSRKKRARPHCHPELSRRVSKIRVQLKLRKQNNKNPRRSFDSASSAQSLFDKSKIWNIAISDLPSIFYKKGDRSLRMTSGERKKERFLHSKIKIFYGRNDKRWNNYSLSPLSSRAQPRDPAKRSNSNYRFLHSLRFTRLVEMDNRNSNGHREAIPTLKNASRAGTV